MTAFSRALIAVSVVAVLAGSAAVPAQAAETPAKTGIQELSFVSLPGRYTHVSGDSGIFRELHWMNTGYVGGATDFTLKGAFADDITVLSEAHAIVDENDYGAMLEIEKEDLWYIKGDYSEFRKYFDTRGGFYRPFTTINYADTDRDLRLDIGKIELEAGIRPKNFPDITFLYEREFKQGTKSRLTWTNLRGTLGSTANEKIAPSWQSIDEIVNKFEVKAEDDLAGFHWEAEQGWENVRSQNQRQERSISVNSTASELRTRDQFIEPRSDLISSQLNVDRWFMKDKVRVSSGFRWAQINSRELENLFETEASGLPTSGSSENVRNSYSDNLYTTNTWVSSFMTTMARPFTIIARGKAETIKRTSSSSYQKDSTGLPDGIPDQIDTSENQESVMDWGQSVSIRYAGIPGLAIYNDYDFEQVRNTLNENRTSRAASSGEIFSREDITHMFRGVYTLGARYYPWQDVSLTTQVRRRDDDIRYNHVRYTNSTTGGAKSVFVDAEYFTTNELSSKIGWKPVRWFQPAFRHQLQEKNFESWGLPNSDVAVETQQLSNIYTADLVSQPTDDLLTTVSFSYQDAEVLTPAQAYPSTTGIPASDIDVYSALFSAEWAIGDKLLFIGTAQYSQATNYKDYSAYGLPYSSDFNKTDVTAALEWQMTKTVQVQPTYAFYTYHGDPDSNPGSYNAHSVMLEVKIDWI